MRRQVVYFVICIDLTSKTSVFVRNNVAVNCVSEPVSVVLKIQCPFCLATSVSVGIAE
jgi:hypothetical protein